MNDKPNYVRLQEIRDELCKLRNEIATIRNEDKLWEGWLSPCEGGITCVLTATHTAYEEMKKHYDKWGFISNLKDGDRVIDTNHSSKAKGTVFFNAIGDALVKWDTNYKLGITALPPGARKLEDVN